MFYVDETKTPAQVKKYSLNIDKEFRDITDPQEIIRKITLEAITKAGISGLLNIDLKSVAGDLTGTVKDIAGDALNLGGDVGDKTLKTTKDAVKETANQIKKLLPFGK